MPPLPHRVATVALTALFAATAHGGFLDQLDQIGKGIGQSLSGTTQSLSQPTTTSTSSADTPTPTPEAPPEQQVRGGILPAKIVYKGYAKEFLPVKQAIYQGNLDDAVAFYESNGKKKLTPTQAADETTAPEGGFDILSLGNDTNEKAQEGFDVTDEKLRFLNYLEMGTLELDRGDSKAAIDNLRQAQEQLGVREDEGELTETAKKALNFGLETLTGNEEIGPYQGEGYERVLMLNYQSIAYLMQGDRRAYNVARMAMDWQDREEEKFKERLSEVESKLAEENKKTDQGQAAETQEALSGNIAKEYARFEDRANRVLSAYSNPFGWYLAGIVQEFDAYEDPSAWDNARIAYDKAAKLNPKSKLIAQTLKAVKKRKSPNKKKKLVHIVIADGFAPEKKVMVNMIPTPRGIASLQLPIYTPTDSQIARIEVQNSKGKRLARLGTIADVEALALRYQKDAEPLNQLRATLGLVRSVIENETLSRVPFGALFSAVRQEMSTPDTRSWMSLPATLRGARLELSKNTTNLQLVSFDAKGKEVARQKLKLPKGRHGFIYGRSINKNLMVHQAPKLWIDKS
ncbi:hypothetical protein [Endothiovibrio diazotrophicus]